MGSAALGVPRAGNAVQNPYPFDVTVYTVGGVGWVAGIGSAAAQALSSGGSTGVGSPMSFRLPAGAYIATVSGSPGSWKWVVD